jgi:ATP-dependent DNA helicase RecG
VHRICGFVAPRCYLLFSDLCSDRLPRIVPWCRGIIENWGRGTLKMADLTQKAGLPRPEIEEQAGCVVVRFRPSKYIPPRQVKQDLTEGQRAILAVLQGTGGLALREIKQLVASPFEEWELKNDLAFLKTLGLVDSKGHGRGAYWFLVGE